MQTSRHTYLRTAWCEPAARGTDLEVLKDKVMQLSCHLNTSGSTTTDHKRQQLLALLLRRLQQTRGAAASGSCCEQAKATAQRRVECPMATMKTTTYTIWTTLSLLPREDPVRACHKSTATHVWQCSALKALADAPAQVVGILDGLEEHAVLLDTLDAKGVVYTANLQGRVAAVVTLLLQVGAGTEPEQPNTLQACSTASTRSLSRPESGLTLTCCIEASCSCSRSKAVSLPP